MSLVAPFPYFGGKRDVAATVWASFGRIANYVEPFFGSGAVLLGRDEPVKTETVNDADGMVANFWRAVRAAPEDVATHADWPVSELDLTARHLWLVGQRERISEALERDPDWFDVKAAGWWVWGACAWIGSGWCTGEGPWQVTENGLEKLSNRGQGINRQLPHLSNRGQGINRQLPHLGNRGQGINRQLPHLGDRGRGILATMHALAERLRDVRVCCGDWSRVLSPTVTWRFGDTGIFLDPPYPDGAIDYGAGDRNVAADVRAWCVENGANPKLKIALCGYREHDDLAAHGWRAHRWKARGGYSSQDGENQNAREETIWFSPACADASMPLFGGAA